MRPAPLTRAQRRPRISESGRWGTLRLSTVRTGAANSMGRRATARSAADSQGSGPSPTRSETASALMPSWLAVERGTDRAGVEHGAAHVDAVVDARHHEVGLGPDGPEGTGDDRQGGGGIEAIGLHVRRPLDEGPLVADGRVIGYRTHGGTGAAEVGARCHHDDLVRRIAARPVGPGCERPGQGGQAGGGHAVVVGDQDPHGEVTLPPAVPWARAGPSPVRVPVTSASRAP